MLRSMKGKLNNNTIIVGDFNTPLTPMERSTKQKISKETHTLNDTTDQLDLIDSYRTFYPKTMNFTFFSSAHGTFSRIDHILGHNSSLGKFKKVKIISSIFSDHNVVRLDVNYKEKKTIKNTNMWRLTTHFCSVQFSRSVVSDSLRPHESQHARPPCPSPSPGVHRLTSIESVMPSSHLILCRPLLLLPPIPPSIRVFSKESTVRMRWPKYWSFSFSIILSKEIPGLISFRMD